jgi:predicted AAA+ superfamily ATPase
MQNLRDFKDEHVIKVVTGMRRCGKSTLFEMFADELRGQIQKNRIQFYNTASAPNISKDESLAHFMYKGSIPQEAECDE